MFDFVRYLSLLRKPPVSRPISLLNAKYPIFDDEK